ncbi:MAG: TrmH family RNA methyltransferase [bacterium]
MKPRIVILENIRSAYNVGNIIRTADALGRDVITTGYTPSPATQPKVKKTSLGAEESISLESYETIQEAIEKLQKAGYTIAAAEITQTAIPLATFAPTVQGPLAVIFGNEVTGVEKETLELVSSHVYIPMQ